MCLSYKHVVVIQRINALQAQPAVYHQNLASDKVRPCRKEEHRLGYIIHASVTLHGRFSGKVG